MRRSLVVCLFLLVPAADARAGFAVAPGSLTNSAGSNPSAVFLSLASGPAAATIQQVYGASQLADLPVGAVITGLRFRLYDGSPAGPAADLTFPNFDVTLGPSNFAPGSLSDDVAANQGPGTTLVRNGPLTFAADSFLGGSGAVPFGPLVAFSTPYTYTGGDLLLGVSYQSPAGELFIAAAFDVPDVEYRLNPNVYGSGTVPFGNDGFAFVTGFEFGSAAAVPAPPAGVLAATGGLLLLRLRRRF